MRQFSLKRIAAVAVSALILCSASTPGLKSRKSKEYGTADMTVPVPRFSIAVKLSERALQRLQSLHESVRVIAYFDGDPLPGQDGTTPHFEMSFLGNDED